MGNLFESINITFDLSNKFDKSLYDKLSADRKDNGFCNSNSQLLKFILNNYYTGTPSSVVSSEEPTDLSTEKEEISESNSEAINDIDDIERQLFSRTT